MKADRSAARRTESPLSFYCFPSRDNSKVKVRFVENNLTLIVSLLYTIFNMTSWQQDTDKQIAKTKSGLCKFLSSGFRLVWRPQKKLFTEQKRNCSRQKFSFQMSSVAASWKQPLVAAALRLIQSAATSLWLLVLINYLKLSHVFKVYFGRWKPSENISCLKKCVQNSKYSHFVNSERSPVEAAPRFNHLNLI